MQKNKSQDVKTRTPTKTKTPVPSSKVLKKKKKKVSKAKSGKKSGVGGNNSATKSADVLIEGGESSSTPETAKGSGANDNGQDQEIDPTVESPETNEDAPEENVQDDDEGKGVDTRLEKDERAGSPELDSLISSVDEVKAGQPLWDLLWKTRATASQASISPRRAKREQKRHRMYKKLLKEQLRAVEKQVATQRRQRARGRGQKHTKSAWRPSSNNVCTKIYAAPPSRGWPGEGGRKNAPLTACSKLP